jgi:hypothetical protein
MNRRASWCADHHKADDQMTIFENDQCTTTTLVASGTHANVNAAQLKAVSPAGSVYTFTATWMHIYNGRHLDYRKGASYVLDPGLKAVLLASAAPMVAA